MSPQQLGVITPYEGQRAHVTNTLLQKGPLRQDLYRAVEVSSVDAFQVGERPLPVDGVEGVGGCKGGAGGVKPAVLAPLCSGRCMRTAPLGDPPMKAGSPPASMPHTYHAGP